MSAAHAKQQIPKPNADSAVERRACFEAPSDAQRILERDRVYFLLDVGAQAKVAFTLPAQ